MGFFDSIFGGGQKEYPPLDADSAAAKNIKEMPPALEELCQQTSDPIELIPTSETAYLFLGAPPKRFAITWVDKDGTIHNFKSLIEEKGVPQIKLERLIGLVGNAYRESKNEGRFSTTLGGKTIVVTPSELLAGNLKKVIAEAVG